jgi:hypothetical protein
MIPTSEVEPECRAGSVALWPLPWGSTGPANSVTIRFVANFDFAVICARQRRWQTAMAANWVAIEGLYDSSLQAAIAAGVALAIADMLACAYAVRFYDRARKCAEERDRRRKATAQISNPLASNAKEAGSGAGLITNATSL